MSEQNNLEFLKTRFGENAFKDDRSLNNALTKAHADMSRRASGHTKNVKDECVEYLTKKFEEEKKNGFKDFRAPDTFDAWHKEVCEKLTELKGIGNFKMTYGRAQKVVNMAFKYLSYVEDYKENIEYSCCHMTLDSYTLAWYNDKVRNWHNEKIPSEKKNKFDTPWSQIEEKDYLEIQKHIREYLEEQPRSYSLEIEELHGTKTIPLPKEPFNAELIVWEGEIIKKRCTDTIKALKLYFEGDGDKRKETGKEADKWILGNGFSEYLKDTINNNL